MSKFPLLDQLRDQNERIENEITAHLKESVQLGIDTIRSLRETVSGLRESQRTLEHAMGSGIAQHVMERAAFEIDRMLRPKIAEMVQQAHRQGSGPMTIVLDAEQVRWMNPKSLERTVLEYFLEDTLPKLSLEAIPNREAKATIIDVRIPAMGYQTALHPGFR